MNIYVGNLSFDITGDDLQEAFGAFGYVSFVQVIKDRLRGDSTRFGFVEMPNTAEAKDAIRRIRRIRGECVTINAADPNVDYASRGGNGKGLRAKKVHPR